MRRDVPVKLDHDGTAWDDDVEPVVRRVRGQRPRFRQQQHDRGPGEFGQERPVAVPVVVQPHNTKLARPADHHVLP